MYAKAFELNGNVNGFALILVGNYREDNGIYRFKHIFN